jgi:porphobilinogen deaminase
MRDDLTIEVAGSATAALAALDEGRAGAALVGRCDLERFGRGEAPGQTFEEMAFLPPPGRGAATLLARAGDEATAALAAPANDPAAHAALQAELAFASDAPAGFALGAFAMLDAELLALRVLLARSADSRLWFGDAAGPPESAADLGSGLAARLTQEVG